MADITYHVEGLAGLAALLERDLESTEREIEAAKTQRRREYLRGYRDALQSAIWTIQHTEVLPESTETER